ncbi:hypothetical protein LCGC14_1099810, partial [marine sediment metagenome]
LSDREDIRLILYTSSYPDQRQNYIDQLAELGIEFDYINENPEIRSYEDFGYYEEKPYFDVYLDDKAGFDPEDEWVEIYEFLKENPAPPSKWKNPNRRRIGKKDKEYTEEDTPNFGMFNSESSFYSKTKHVAEMMLHGGDPEPMLGWLFRIRMPFCGEDIPRNYFNKLLGYDNLISMNNSMTSVDDLCEFTYKFIKGSKYLPYGAYNVVNEGAMCAEDIVKIMRMEHLTNPNHKFISLDELQTKAKRSNCVLSTQKIQAFGLHLPPLYKSVRKAVSQLREAKG